MADHTTNGGGSRHVDVTLSAEQHAQLSREAERQGKTLAAYMRESGLESTRRVPAVDAPVSGDQMAALRQLSADMRALVVVMAGVGAVITQAEDGDRETLVQSALAMYDKIRRLGVKDDE